MRKTIPMQLSAKEARRLFVIIQDNRYKSITYSLRSHNTNGEGKLLEKMASKYQLQNIVKIWQVELKFRRLPEQSTWEQGEPGKALPPTDGQGYWSTQTDNWAPVRQQALWEAWGFYGMN